MLIKYPRDKVGTQRTKCKFALFPVILNAPAETIVWLEYYYEHQQYEYRVLSNQYVWHTTRRTLNI